MNKHDFSVSFRLATATLPFILAGAAAVAQTASYSVIANMGIHLGEGFYPRTSVVFDHDGNIFAIATGGGSHGEGTAFELSPKANGQWTEKTIANFSRGASGPLVLDAGGNIYGTATEGQGTNRLGTVFELSPSSDGSWSRTNIHVFHGGKSGGSFPVNGVVFDKEGNLYGTALGGGLYSGGVVFELLQQQDGSWTETDLYNFNSEDLEVAHELTIDEAGNLYGTAEIGGTCRGVAFSLTKPESNGGSWSYTTLHTFPGYPVNGDPIPGNDVCRLSKVIFDKKGNLYGTGTLGGKYGFGGIFQIPAGSDADRDGKQAPAVEPGGPDTVIYSFNSPNSGATSPYGALTIDRSGNLYGTTMYGGPYSILPASGGTGGGKMFELLPQTDGSWSVRALHEFGGRTYDGDENADGFSPNGGMVFGPDGNLYGTTIDGGYYPGEPQGEENFGHGTVFKFVTH